MRNNPRGGTITKFKSNVGDSFGVTKERALNGVRKSIPVFKLLMEDACIENSKGVAQRRYIALNEINFEKLTRRRRCLMSSRDVDSWSNEEKLAVR